MAIAEVMEDTIAVALHHLGMDVEAGVAQLRHLFGQQLHPVYRVAEDEGLGDLQLHSIREKQVRMGTGDGSQARTQEICARHKTPDAANRMLLRGATGAEKVQ